MTHIVSDRIVMQIAKNFGIEAHRVLRAEGGFSGASVFRVESLDGRVFAIRKTPESSTMPAARLKALHCLLASVNGQGVSVVPVPIEPIQKRFLNLHETDTFETADSWLKVESEFWQAEPWMPGSPADNELTNEQLQSALQCLHSFHEAAVRAVSTASPNEWFFLKSDVSPGLIRRLHIVTELSDGFLNTLKADLAGDPDSEYRELAFRFCESLSARLPWLLTRLRRVANQKFSLQPVLRDVWRAHVLFTQGRVTGLIDLLAASTDHVTLDMARLFRSWFGNDVRRIHDAASQFSEFRPLDEIEWRLLEAFDASTVLLSPVTWLRRRFVSGERTPCHDDILSRLNELTEIAEHFRPLPG